MSAGNARRLLAAARGALAPVAAGLVALFALMAWAGSGAAGTPPRLQVTDARMLLPFSEDGVTVAVFTVRNSGNSDDQLISVSSPDAVRTAVTATAPRGQGAAAMAPAGVQTVPARGTLTMSPYGTDVMVQLRTAVRLGDRIRFELRFRHSDPVETYAVVVRPGG
ncbi:copper chaperone PCu(A)C [Streptomyces sp. NPDC046977]|uniref:copper chaperone PCu(A)C n=1 Tax=Streptomyces sp. NPDC046977 TaxID=3154703 RepID=UPI0033D156F3